MSSAEAGPKAQSSRAVSHTVAKKPSIVPAKAAEKVPTDTLGFDRRIECFFNKNIYFEKTCMNVNNTSMTGSPKPSRFDMTGTTTSRPN